MAAEPFWKIIHADVRAGLRQLEANSIQCICTSPPYWSLRDYKTEPQTWASGWVGELGREPTIAQYVANLVEVFRDVRRVLHPSGTVFLNLGDSFAGSGKGG